MEMRLFFVMYCILSIVFCMAQTTDSKFQNDRAILLVPSYTGCAPIGKLSSRFGYTNKIGFLFGYNIKKNWMIGIEGSYIHIGNMKDNSILASIATVRNGHINTNNFVGAVTAEGRGFDVKLVVGKFFPIVKKRQDMGIITHLGLGFLQHQIYINVRPELYPQLDKTYRKGYDRLTNGPVLSLFTGFQMLKIKRYINFYIGPNIDLAITQNRRNMNFDTGKADKGTNVDVFIGGKFGFIIPFFSFVKAEKVNADEF